MTPARTFTTLLRSRKFKASFRARPRNSLRSLDHVLRKGHYASRVPHSGRHPAPAPSHAGTTYQFGEAVPLADGQTSRSESPSGGSAPRMVRAGHTVPHPKYTADGRLEGSRPAAGRGGHRCVGARAGRTLYSTIPLRAARPRLLAIRRSAPKSSTCRR